MWRTSGDTFPPASGTDREIVRDSSSPRIRKGNKIHPLPPRPPYHGRTTIVCARRDALTRCTNRFDVRPIYFDSICRLKTKKSSFTLCLPFAADRPRLLALAEISLRRVDTWMTDCSKSEPLGFFLKIYFLNKRLKDIWSKRRFFLLSQVIHRYRKIIPKSIFDFNNLN